MKGSAHSRRDITFEIVIFLSVKIPTNGNLERMYVSYVSIQCICDFSIE